MGELISPRVLFVGAGPEALWRANKWFDPQIVGHDVAVRGYLVDPYFQPSQGDDLPHVQIALAANRLTVGGKIPQRPFNVAYIAPPDGDASHVLRGIANLKPLPRWIILENPPAYDEEAENRWERLLTEWDRLSTANLLVNQPYLLSEGVRRLHEIVDYHTSPDNPVVGINFRYQEHRTPPQAYEASELGLFGGELCRALPMITNFLNSELTLDRIPYGRNLRYQPVFRDETAQAAYTEFKNDAVTVRLAQVFGNFAINHFGRIVPQEAPAPQRQISLELKNYDRLELELLPAFDARVWTQESAKPHSTLTVHTRRGPLTLPIADDPIKKLIRSVIAGLREPGTPPLPGLDVRAALKLCTTIRRLRNSASVRPYPTSAGRGRSTLPPT